MPQFCITGEFLTDHIRDMFQSNKCTLDQVTFFVEESLGIANGKDLAKGIIEGRKKLIGVVSLDLVDDDVSLSLIPEID